MQYVQATLRIVDLGAKLADRRLKEHEILQLRMIDVHAPHLEKAHGAPLVMQQRVHAPWSLTTAVLRYPDEVARIPSQERRHRVVPKRCHGQRADLAVLLWFSGHFVHHFAIEQVRPEMGPCPS